jgi:hypothetical protein
MKYEQVFDGEWIEPKPQRGHKMRCCDCALIHVMDFRVKAGKVQFRPRRDKRATAAARRGKRVTNGDRG